MNAQRTRREGAAPPSAGPEGRPARPGPAAVRGGSGSQGRMALRPHPGRNGPSRLGAPPTPGS